MFDIYFGLNLAEFSYMFEYTGRYRFEQASQIKYEYEHFEMEAHYSCYVCRGKTGDVFKLCLVCFLINPNMRTFWDFFNFSKHHHIFCHDDITKQNFKKLNVPSLDIHISFYVL
jgi:hypothetical protein